MTFTVNRKALADELAILQSVVAGKQLIPVLATVMVGLVGDELSLTATDLDVTISTTLTAQGDGWGGCLPCRQLYELVKLMDADTITFAVKGTRMEVSAGESKHLLPITAIADFPEIEQPNGEEFALPLPQLAAMIDATAFALLAARDEVKPSDLAFTGLCLRGNGTTLEALATQKTVTAVAEMSCEAVLDIILPRGAVAALLRLQGETVTVAADSNHAQFTAGNRTITARLLLGKFPAWRDFIPKFKYQVTVDKNALTAAIRRASVTADNTLGYEAMKLTASAGELMIETRGGDSGQSREPVAVTGNLNGEPLAIGFFAHQVLSALVKCDEQVACELDSPDKPMAFKSARANYFVMPIRLKF